MKAIEYIKYGDSRNLKLVQIDKPAPNDNEVLVKIFASSINSADKRMLMADPFLVRLMQGLFKPKNTILGMDIAGLVEAVGSSVKRFKVGDEIYGDVSENGMGAYAEYKCIPEDGVIALKPKNISYEKSAAVPLAGMTALQGFRHFGKIEKGQKVLVNGASGGVGSFAVLLAKAYGAHVTGVCSTKSVDIVRSMGCDVVIDYKKDDFININERYDFIFDVAANHFINEYKKVLNPRGICVVAGFSAMPQMIKFMIQSKFASKNGGMKFLNMGSSKPTRADLESLRSLIEDKRLIPVIDRIYQLEELSEAMRYFDKEHARAKVIISVCN